MVEETTETIRQTTAFEDETDLVVEEATEGPIAETTKTDAHTTKIKTSIMTEQQKQTTQQHNSSTHVSRLTCIHILTCFKTIIYNSNLIFS